MHLWTKLTSLKWVDAWEERFAGGRQGILVVTAVAGRDMARLELYCPSEKAARMVQREFGGSLRKSNRLPPAALPREPLAPVKARDALVVCPARTRRELEAARREYPGRSVIAVPPDMAFGTGRHPTTATILRLLVDLARDHARAGRSWAMGDLGCGSGILALAGRKLGAASSWGCDFDPSAVRAARDNAKRNGVPEVRFEAVDVTRWNPSPEQRWEVVAANLFAGILKQAFPAIREAVKPGGIVLLSGLLADGAEDCLAAARDAGLAVEARRRAGKWVTAVARRS